MDQKPLISIVIPVYNCAGYVNETIQSVVKSSYPNWEIILINDGSTDRSPAVCKEWETKYPEKIRLIDQRNQGPSVARNVGIFYARGEFILPLDSDDKIHPEYIGLAIAQFQSDEQTKVVYCEAEKFGEKSGPWNLKPFSLKQLALDNMIFVSGVFRKKDWEDVGGYDPRLIWGWEDWEFWINLLKHGGKVVKLPQVGFYYRIRKGSRRKSTNKEAKRLTIDLLNKKHPEFFEHYLHGPLRNPRGISIWVNGIHSLLAWKPSGIGKNMAGQIHEKRKPQPLT